MKMGEAVSHFKTQGVTHFIFGDIFLADVKAYREGKLNPLDIEVVEPLWSYSPAEVMQQFLQSGIRAKIIVTQADKLDQSFAGLDLDAETVGLFPANIDICGENGEYHTFCYAGGMLREEIQFSILRIQKIAYDIKLDDGRTETFEYWQAVTEAQARLQEQECE
jgi:diphthamide synthase (EF-2-diphthine--ammonia ligase)